MKWEERNAYIVQELIFIRKPNKDILIQMKSYFLKFTFHHISNEKQTLS